MKAGTNLQQRSHSSPDANLSPGWLGNAAKDLQQGAFACPVSPDDTYSFTGLYFEIDILQRPKLLLAALLPLVRMPAGKQPFCAAGDRIPQGCIPFRRLMSDQESL